MITAMAIGKFNEQEINAIITSSRAFGASNLILTQEKDRGIIDFCRKLNSKWGGNFYIEFTKDWMSEIKSRKMYKVVYLTQFGIQINKRINVIRTYRNLILIVTKNDPNKEIMEVSDFNVSITGQPHTCSAAMSIFLHDFYQGRELALHFENAKYKVVPQERGFRIDKIV